MKKILAIILAAVMVTAMAAACGSSGGGSATTAAPAETTAAPAETTAAPADNTAAADETTAPQEETETSAEAAVEVPNPTGPQEMIVGVQADPGSLFPGGTPNSGKRTMTHLVYERLFYPDPATGEYVKGSGLGKDYEYLGDGKFHVEIFDYIKDSEGNPITSSDVKFTLEKNVENGQNEYYVSDFEIEDDYNFTVTFSPYALFCFDQFLELNIFAEKAYNDSGDALASKTFGTGMYKLTESSPGSSYTFERRDDYWQTDSQYLNQYNTFYLDKITMKVITDTSAIAMALEKGEIDFSMDIAAADYANFIENGEAKEGYGLVNGEDHAMVRVDFNCGPNSLCQDENLRKAIAYAIDSDACAYTIHGDFGHQVLEAINPKLKDADESLYRDDYYLYDPAKAKEYLDKSSYNGETIKVLVAPNKNIAPMTTLVQQYLAAVGINVELMQYEFAQFKPLKWETTGTEWDMMLQGLSSSDLYEYQTIEELGPRDGVSGENLLYFDDPELTKLFLATTQPETYGLEATKAILDYNYEHCFMYGMYYGDRLAIFKDYVHGVYTEPNGGSAMYRTAYITK